MEESFSRLEIQELSAGLDKELEKMTEAVKQNENEEFKKAVERFKKISIHQFKILGITIVVVFFILAIGFTIVKYCHFLGNFRYGIGLFLWVIASLIGIEALKIRPPSS